MRKLLAVGVLVLALGALSFGHGGAEHVMGTVKAMTENSITVVTKTNQEKTVTFDASTKFMKSGEAVTVKDLKVGDRVVIEVHEVGTAGRLHAAEVRFGKKPTASQTQQSPEHTH